MHTRTGTGLIGSLGQRWFVLGLLVLLLALSFQYSLKALSNRSAILRWREQLHHLADEDIYQRYTYPNPPIMALLLSPLAELPPLVGSLAWFYLKVGMTLLALAWVFRLVESPARPFPAWAKALALLLSLRPIMGDLAHGNVNLFILFLVVGALYAFHQGRDLTAGLVLALSIACKVTPALFLPYFLWKRAWKTLAGAAAGLVLFLVVVPSLFLGSERNFQLFGSWLERMVAPYVIAGTVTSEHPNQSLPGLAFRLGTHSPSFLDDHGEPLQYHNLATLDPARVRWFLKGCMFLFAAVVVWSCRTPLTPRQGWRLAAEFSIVVLGMLLFSERTWKHHCVTLLLPFAVLTYYLAVCPGSRLLRGYLITSLVAVVLLMASTSTSLLEAWDGAAKMAQVYGAYVWAALILVAALVVLLRKTEDGGPGAHSSTQPSVLRPDRATAHFQQ
jgi:alpha-1,2-mannosyltransferase